MSNQIFEVNDVSYAYPDGKAVLDGITFRVSEGESIAILGANASGKSTLLHLLDGLYFPTAGSIHAFGNDINEESVERLPFSREFRQRVGFLFQNSDAQLFCSTVEEELAFGPLQLRLTEQEVEQRIDDVLELFEIEHLRRRSPQTLSGGEKKKVALASLITCGPRVILLDEPSSGLDPRTQQWLTEFLVELNSNGVTLITSSHDLSFIAEISQRALVLSEDHRLLADGQTREIFGYLDLLLSANLIHAHIHRHEGQTHVHPHLHEAWHEHKH